MTLSTGDLSDDQRVVFEAMHDWCEDSLRAPMLRVGGYAGTGKSTLLGLLASQLAGKRLVAYISFTGRASAVLASKLKALGVKTTDRPAPPRNAKLTASSMRFFNFDLKAAEKTPFVGTIHRLCYKPLINEKEEILGFRRRDELDRAYDLIVVDEASMVGDDILAVLRSFGVPILAVGDHGQLAPVGQAGDLMRDPDLRLEKIHRQAESSPIIRLSRTLRETGWWRSGEGYGEILFKGRREAQREGYGSVMAVLREATAAGFSAADTGILCWTNMMRIKLNQVARRTYGFSGVPRKGELVIALQNKPPIFNGMRGQLTTDGRLDGHHLDADVAFDGIDGAHSIDMCAAQFNKERPFRDVEELASRGIIVDTMRAAGDFYDFGYALTVHKSQGSQFRHAIVWADHPCDPSSPDWRRWIYTAVTRASERLTVFT